MNTTMANQQTISQISADAESRLKKQQMLAQQNRTEYENTKYSELVEMCRERVVRLLIDSATNGKHQERVNFNIDLFSCGLGRPCDVFVKTINRMIASDARMAGVQFTAWTNGKKTTLVVVFNW